MGEAGSRRRWCRILRLRGARYSCPLTEWIVSFHRGRADKNLIKLVAHNWGSMGCSFSWRGPNEGAILDCYAELGCDGASGGLLSLAGDEGMTVWVHELSDLRWGSGCRSISRAGVGRDNEWVPVCVSLANRYEWLLGKAIPNVDGLVLTVVETQVRATAVADACCVCYAI